MDKLNADNKFQPKNVLIVHKHKDYGGAETHVLKQYKELLKIGHNVIALIPNNTILVSIFTKENLPFYTTHTFGLFPVVRFFNKLALAGIIYWICKKHNINIINCHADCELKAAKLAAKFLNAKVILTRHVQESAPISSLRIKNVDGIIAVNPEIQKSLLLLNQKQNLGIKHVEFIAPFFNDENFTNFKTNETRQEFFKNNFNINLTYDPILCMAASMHDDRKNQPLIIKAIHDLVYNKQKPVQLMLAGSGEMIETYKELSRSLNLEKYVHFLGFVKKAPDIFYHSDINILTSTDEAFGLSLVEAALLKKPLIGTAGTGMETIIKHNQTGLLFENNNIDDLVQKIETLVDDKDLQRTLGQNAFDYVNENFLTEAGIRKFNDLMDKVLSN